MIILRFSTITARLKSLATPQRSFGINNNSEWNLIDSVTSPDNVQETFSFTAGRLNGELVTITDSANLPAGSTNYTYNVFGHLKSVTLPNGSQITYLLDAFNRRVGKRVNTTLTKQFLWQDNLKIAAEYDGSGNLISEFIYAQSVNAPDYMIRGGIKYNLIKDNLGSVLAVGNAANGVVAQQLTYSTYGKVLTDSNPGFQPFGFAGGLYDPDTKLVRFGAREYNGTIGRWMTKDPILFNGGDTNLYGYVLQDPVNYWDPFGLYWFRQPWQEPGQVGRVGSIVPPAPNGQISDFIERYVPAGYTFGQNHDRFVDWGRGLGAPDWLVNIPSMIPSYGYSVGQEALRSSGIFSQPTPHEGQMCN